ncbi:MAG: CBS domain-containing protein [Phycisphaerae bacterium]|nr:CBS domain-containing protein [Phycisphaerae bacterium]
MTLGSIMTGHVVSVGMDDSLHKVKELFDQRGFHHLIVLEGGRLAGIISDRDLLRNLSPFIGSMGERKQDAATLERRAHQVMTRGVVTAPASMSIEDGGRLMLRRRISALLIVDERGVCTGIVTWRDLLRWALGREPAAEESRAA